MKVVKDGVFYFIIFYIVFISILFIKQTITIENTMNKKHIIEFKEENKIFLNESKEKIKALRKKTTTDKERVCLNELEKAIDISYEHQTLGTLTYKEIMSYYYNQEDFFHNYTNIRNSCYSEEDKNSSAAKSIVKHIMTNNVVLIENNFMESKTLYLLNLTFNSNYMDPYSMIFMPATDGIIKKSGQDIQSRVFNNEKLYIQELLDLVGDKYE